MRHRLPRHALTAAALLATLAVSACAGGGNDRPVDGADGGGATGSSRGTESSSSSPWSPSPLPPVAPLTPPTPPTTSPPVAPAPAGPLVGSATWADSDYGETLKIAPTEAGRLADGVDDARTAWREVLALAPDADTPGMWEQFDCHWTWARTLEPDKPTWNVEPWRPVVDEGQMITDGCNPGGPEV